MSGPIINTSLPHSVERLTQPRAAEDELSFILSAAARFEQAAAGGTRPVHYVQPPASAEIITTIAIKMFFTLTVSSDSDESLRF